jgi:hypothetical protein
MSLCKIMDYVQFNNIDATDFETLYKLSKQYKTKPIFHQEIQTETTDKNKLFDNDNKRSSSNPIQNKKDPVIVKTMSGVNQHAELINPKFKVQKAVFLCSEAGCLLQAEHTDGTPTTGDFCSCVLAIQDGTKIMMNGQTIYLNVGEAIFFHSDAFHRGCDYVKANNRLFFYIAEEKKDIPSDGVGDLQPRYCDYCNDFLYYESAYEYNEENVAEYDLQEFEYDLQVKKLKIKKRSVVDNHNRYCNKQKDEEELLLNRDKDKMRKRCKAAATAAAAAVEPEKKCRVAEPEKK